MNDHYEWYHKKIGDSKQHWHTSGYLELSVSRVSTLLATLLTMGLLSSTPATAHRYLVENKEVKGSEVFATTGTFFTPIVIEGKISGKKVGIECNGGSDKDEIEKEGHSKGGEITLEGCVIHEIKEGKETNLTECTVSNPVLKFKDSLITGAGESVEVELQPNTGTSFGEFELSGTSCGIKGKEKIESATEGKGPVCFVGITGEVEDTEQFAECTPTGSKELRMGSEKAGFNALFTMTVTVAGCPNMWRME